MKLAVTVKYGTTPGGYPGSIAVVVIESASNRTSDVKELVQAQHPYWYNLQIAKIQPR